jgi:RHS repeat-associated protein
LEGHDTNLPPVTLQHVGARWYDPSIGRFVMRDPIGLEGGLNEYAYSESSPVALVDATGNSPWLGDEYRKIIDDLWRRQFVQDAMKKLMDAGLSKKKAWEIVKNIIRKTPKNPILIVVAACYVVAEAGHAAQPGLEGIRQNLKRMRYQPMKDVGVKGYDY